MRDTEEHDDCGKVNNKYCECWVCDEEIALQFSEWDISYFYEHIPSNYDEIVVVQKRITEWIK